VLKYRLKKCNNPFFAHSFGFNIPACIGQDYSLALYQNGFGDLESHLV
jgi:hypothetical protein